MPAAEPHDVAARSGTAGVVGIVGLGGAAVRAVPPDSGDLRLTGATLAGPLAPWPLGSPRIRPHCRPGRGR